MCECVPSMPVATVRQHALEGVPAAAPVGKGVLLTLVGGAYALSLSLSLSLPHSPSLPPSLPLSLSLSLSLSPLQMKFHTDLEGSSFYSLLCVCVCVGG